MERRQAAELELGEFCDFEWCQVLAAYEFTNQKSVDYRMFGRAFRERFGDRSFPSKFQIGKVKEIEARTGCPSCRVAHDVIKSSDDPDLTPDSLCYVEVYDANFYWGIGYYSADGRHPHLQSDLWEQITFLGNNHLSHYRSARLVDSPKIDYERIGSWLRLCDNLHTVCPLTTKGKKSNYKDLLPQLRVVDMQNMCLTEIPWGERYVALSYVWGGAAPPLLLKGDLELWEEHDSIRAREDSFPQTIRDAMEVVRNLGLRYFWFDSLCLLQDDLEDLHRNINNMDTIYEEAYLTIVAANSASADDGLPGVWKARHPHQRVFHLKPNLSIAIVPLLGPLLKHSAWATRGWTLQEQLLSRRALAFINDQVYFQCRECTWSEDRMTDQTPEKKHALDWSSQLINMVRQCMDEMEYPLSPYDFLFAVLEAFQKRNITRDDDAHNAVAGLLRRVSDAGNTDMIEGLSAKLLPMGLLFNNRKEDSQRRSDVRRRADFPSWSWTGWCAPSYWCMWREVDTVQGEQKIVEWLTDANWITWSASKAGSAPRAIHDPATIKHEFAAEIGLEYTDTDLLSNPTTAIPGEGYSREEPVTTPYLLHPAQKGITSPNLPIPTNLPYSLLVFHTTSIRLRVGSTVTGWNFNFHLIDNTDSLCGEVNADYPPDCPPSATENPDTEAGIEKATADGPVFEFVVLSERHHKPNQNAVSFLDNNYDQEFADIVVKDTYWIMMIEYLEDKGVYERRGLGFVQKTSIENSFAPGPVWKEIILA